jgi:uncharacterized protein (TIGR02271 family)
MAELVDVRQGMRVVGSDGADVGTLVRVEGDHLVVRKGSLLPRHDAIAISDVADVWGEVVRLAVTGEDVARSRVGARRDGARRTALTAAAPGAPRTDRARDLPPRREETRVPLAEEELVAEKHVRALGEVRVYKRTVVERRLVEVPVKREEVYIRRVELPRHARSRAPDAAPAEAAEAFTARTITIPVYEEEIEIVKRPRVVQEIRVTKAFRELERHVEGTIRREVADVRRTDGDGAPDLH